MDLTIDVPNGVYLGLENKIGAAEQDDQIRDYIDFVKRQRKDRPDKRRFVFLTKSGVDPVTADETQIKEHKESRQLVCYSYLGDVPVWLQRCANRCSADRVRLFLQDLASWAQDLVQGGQMDLGKATLITELVSKNADRLDAALSIMENGEFVRALLVAPLIEAIKTGLKRADQFPESEWEFAEDKNAIDLLVTLRNGGNGRDTGIYIRRRTWPAACSIGISPEWTGVVSGLIYGVMWPGADSESAKELSLELNRREGTGKRSSVGPWYRPVPPLVPIMVRDLGTCQAIRAIYSGQGQKEELVNHFVGLFERIAGIVSDVLQRPQ